MAQEQLIKQFFKCKSFAVVGASSNREKFGNKVLRKYVEKGLQVTPVNPTEKVIENLTVKQLEELTSPETIGISIITPPKVSEGVIKKAHKLGFSHIWLQPGAESSAVISLCQSLKIDAIHSGPCVLVELGKNKHKL